MTRRESTHPVQVGNVQIGGGAPVSVQTMTNAKTSDTKKVLQQIDSAVQHGCELIRVAIPHKDSLDGFEEVVKKSPIPVIADIHFDYKLAIEAAKRGAAKIRINPGNIGNMDKVDAIIDEALNQNIPIRIGVNAGSLEARIREKGGWSLEDKLVASSLSFVEHFESKNFYDIVLSAKAHNAVSTIKTYRRLSEELPHIPLHIGVTEAGTKEQGTVKSSVALGVLLYEGIGDTMRVSLTDDIEVECDVAWEILAASGIRRRTPEIVSCPTCGRCEVDLVGIAKEVTKHIKTMNLPITVAVMGCVVNGPGEAQDADIGIACGKGRAVLFTHGRRIKTVEETDILQELLNEIDKRFVTNDE